jgi:hypothetical protein
MVHSIQSSRKAKVVVNDTVYSGIPHETCVSCHNRGKRIGVSFQGLMEFPYGSPYTDKGDKQPQLHSKFYQFIQDDVHHRLKSREGNPEGGLLCQDCHTTTSMHGNGNITGTLLANVEIECSDCHVKVDFSGDKQATDWVASGHTHFAKGHTAESMRGVAPPVAAGVASGSTSENRTCLRWEDPVLGINGEGRVSPIIPGCQQITTVIAPDGEVLVNNKIWRTAAGVEGGGEPGQRGLDMAPAAPHTVDWRARECTSCHAQTKALGCGTHDGRYLKGVVDGIYVDIMNEKGGCLSCHQEIPEGRFVYRIISKLGDALGMIPATDAEHQKLVGKAMFIAANLQIFGPLVGIVVVLLFVVVVRRKKTS